MFKPGFIALGVAAGFLLLFAVLSYTGLSSFGPCGPNTLVGIILSFAFAVCGGGGLLLIFFGGLVTLFDRIREQAKIPRNR